MNNEILNQILDEVKDIKGELKTTNSRLGNLETEVGGLKTEVGGLKTKVDGLETKVDGLEVETKRISQSVAVIEVEHGRRLGGLEDGQGLILDKLERIETIVPVAEATAIDVELIKNAVTSHSKAINALKSVI